MTYLQWIVAGCLVTMSVTGCGKREETPEQAAATEAAEKAAAPAPAVMNQEQSPEAPVVYSDPASQRIFGEQFQSYLHYFEPPRQNSAVIVELRDGRVVMGNLLGLTPDTIVVNDTSRQRVTLTRQNLSEPAQQQLYADAFAAHLARQATDQNRDGTPLEVLLTAESAQPEPRTMLFDQNVLRAGPGHHFRPMEDSPLLRGARVFAINEKDGWILTAYEPHAKQGLGWIQKTLSFPAEHGARNVIAREVDALKEIGLVSSLDPEQNKAEVNGFRWRIADPAIQEGSSRLLAFYMGHMREGSRNWVEIFDDQSGQRLANFSESKGYRSF